MNPYEIIDPNLKEPEWFNKREEILKRDNYHCRYCNSDKNLEVHHIYYKVGKRPWDYPDELLVTLCRDCHKHWHDLYGIEYCNNDGKPLTLFLTEAGRQIENTCYYSIPFELRDDKGDTSYSGEAVTWGLDQILVDRFGSPLNFCLSHNQNGKWLIPYAACDGHRFKIDICKQLSLPY